MSYCMKVGTLGCGVMLSAKGGDDADGAHPCQPS